jgi:hypothetical protein
MIGLGVASGGCTQLAVGAGEDGQQLKVGSGAVAPNEVVQGDTGRKVFQNEEPGRYVGGDDARGKLESQIVGQELQRGQFGTQPPPGFGACFGGVSPHQFHDDRPGSTGLHEEHSRYSPRLKTLPALDGNGCAAEIR